MAYPSRRAFFASLAPAPELEGRGGDDDEDNDGCQIHSDAFEDPVVTVCNGIYHHFFCRACLTSWLAGHNTCPSCRFVFFPPDQPERLLLILHGANAFDLLAVFIAAAEPRLFQPLPVLIGPVRPPHLQHLYIDRRLLVVLSYVVVRRLGAWVQPRLDGPERRAWVEIYQSVLDWLVGRFGQEMLEEQMREEFSALSATVLGLNVSLDDSARRRLEVGSGALMGELVLMARTRWNRRAVRVGQRGGRGWR